MSIVFSGKIEARCLALFSVPKMKFPVTRESLLAYDPVKQAAEKKEEQLQGALYQMLVQLRNDFEAAMPKDPSQNDTRGISLSRTTKEQDAIARIKDNFEQKRFIWSNLQHKIQEVSFYPGCVPITLEHIPRFIDMVQESFIGCAVIVDPLKTYIIIDWS